MVTSSQVLLSSPGHLVTFSAFKWSFLLDQQPRQPISPRAALPGPPGLLRADTHFQGCSIIQRGTLQAHLCLAQWSLWARPVISGSQCPNPVA